MANVSSALFSLVPESVIYKTLDRTIDGEGVLSNAASNNTIFEARVIPTSLKELNSSDLSSTVKIAFSFYFFDSITFEQNDIINYNEVDYKIFKGWDRSLNGGYTKIIAGIEKNKVYTDGP